MLIGSAELELIRGHQPALRTEESLMHAAVAIILRDNIMPDGTMGTEFLMMQRAKHENDPWSGQMSFPGGKIDFDDVDAHAAAVREVAEEIGVLLESQDYIGRLDDLYGLKADGVFVVHVSCFVFRLERMVEITTNHEVADTVWLPFSYLNEPDNTYNHFYPADSSTRMSAVMIDAGKDQILWGLSLRALVGLHELLGWPMKALSGEDQDQLKSMEKHSLDRRKLNKQLLDAIDRRKQ